MNGNLAASTVLKKTEKTMMAITKRVPCQFSQA